MKSPACCDLMSKSGAMPPVTLGIDLGTSSVKVAAVGFGGELIGEEAASFETDSRVPLQAEQRPSDWVEALSSAALALKETVMRTRGLQGTWNPAAIGLTGQLPTLVCLSGGKAVGSAITWKDGRADAWTSDRLDSAYRAHLYARTGMPIDGRYLAPMLQFHWGVRIEHLTAILSAKDYLLYALTGSLLTEPSTAAGYGVYDLHEACFADELIRFWNLPRRLLPRIEPASALAGRLSAEGAEILGVHPGIPVSTGAADSVCASYAMAELDERVVSISFGSSAVIIGASATPRLDGSARYLLTPHAIPGWYAREMDLLAAGTGYRWLTEVLGWRNGAIDRKAAESVPGAHGLLFPPYLGGGEQGALWNPRLQGALFGLTVRTSQADIARAFLEGVFFEVRRCVEVLAEAVPVDLVKVSGNIVRSASSTQMLADVLGRPVGTVSDQSPAAVGAAILARRISGVAPVEGRRFEGQPAVQPNPSVAREYAAIYRQYLARSASCEGDNQSH
jgi:xylulokinase